MLKSTPHKVNYIPFFGVLSRWDNLTLAGSIIKIEIQAYQGRSYAVTHRNDLKYKRARNGFRRIIQDDNYKKLILVIEFYFLADSPAFGRATKPITSKAMASENNMINAK